MTKDHTDSMGAEGITQFHIKALMRDSFPESHDGGGQRWPWCDEYTGECRLTLTFNGVHDTIYYLPWDIPRVRHDIGTGVWGGNTVAVLREVVLYWSLSALKYLNSASGAPLTLEELGV